MRTEQKTEQHRTRGKYVRWRSEQATEQDRTTNSTQVQNERTSDRTATNEQTNGKTAEGTLPPIGGSPPMLRLLASLSRIESTGKIPAELTTAMREAIEANDGPRVIDLAEDIHALCRGEKMLRGRELHEMAEGVLL